PYPLHNGRRSPCAKAKKQHPEAVYHQIHSWGKGLFPLLDAYIPYKAWKYLSYRKSHTPGCFRAAAFCRCTTVPLYLISNKKEIINSKSTNRSVGRFFLHPFSGCHFKYSATTSS